MAVATTGFFDGVHLGHRAIIETLLKSSKELGERSLVITFYPHPRVALGLDATALKLLTPQSEKLDLIRSFGVDEVKVLEFTREFAAMTTREYLQMLRRDFDVDAVVLGYDNRIGADQLERDAAADVAKSLGLKVILAPKVLCPQGTGEAVSSTLIRKAIAQGDYENASAMLGRKWKNLP